MNGISGLGKTCVENVDLEVLRSFDLKLKLFKTSILLDDFIPRFSGGDHTTIHAKMRCLGSGMGCVEGSNESDPQNHQL